ncbi:hypothetical protein AAHA92_33916 [Salvia divinorum]|uniref:Reverse transcriptase domain-containing protein n=1 Tax=Salvia divinorum TaxID=28513 RepID=A0ABD1FKL2_SALDI
MKFPMGKSSMMGNLRSEEKILSEELKRPLPRMENPFFLDKEPLGERKKEDEVKEKEAEGRDVGEESKEPVEEAKLPSIGKFIKELIAGKVKENERIVVEGIASADGQEKLPPKRADPGMFTLPITIENIKIKHAMCDLGASINVLPLSIYIRLKRVKLTDTRVLIQLVDRSSISPEGVLENVLVKVHDFLYPADFYVIRMSEPEARESSGILLDRPFLRTAKTIVDMAEGTICIDFHGEKFTFNIDEAMKKPMDSENLCNIDVIEPLVQEYLETELLQDRFYAPDIDEQVSKEAAAWCDLISGQGLTDQEIEEAILEFCKKPEFARVTEACVLARAGKSSEQDRLEKKRAEENPLPLEYAFLGEGDSLPVIINNKLTGEQEAKLLTMLGKNKKAIGWSLANLEGISPDICMHHVRIEEGAKAHRDPQRKLNPNMREEVMKEILKLLSLGIIYSVLDSDGYFQIYVDPGDQDKTTFTCPFGTYAYRRMPFGLYNAPGTFQRCMMSIFSDLLEECIENFMDDFTVYGDSFYSCLHHLDVVLERF